MPRKFIFLVLGVYLLAAIFLYRPILNSFFVSDDFDWVARAKNIPLTLENLFLRNADGKLDGAVYRPITSLSFWLNYQISGLAPFGYHLVNVFLYLGSAFLLFWLVWQLGDKKYWLAFLAGLFFLIFPNHPEAVSWISGRNDVLAVFFFLLSFKFYVLFRSVGGRRWQFGASILFFALAIFSKEMAASLPIILLIYELIWQKSALGKKKILFLAAFALILAFYIFLRQLATGLLLHSYSNADSSFSILSAMEFFIRGLVSHFVSPVGATASGGTANYWLLFILLSGLFGLGWRFFTEKKLLVFSFLFFIISLGPAYNLRLNNLTAEGERLIYLPSIGLAVFLAVIIISLLKKSRVAGVIAAMFLIVFFSFNLWQKNLIWQKAGALSRQLLSDFAAETGLKSGEGTVVLGLPDNINGAFIFRNGWLTALKLFYPNYLPDVLPAQGRLNLSRENFNQKIIDWQILPDGYRAISFSSPYLFIGPAQLDSADYLFNIKNYDNIIKVGQEAEFHFSPTFIAQLSSKTINFLVFNEGRLKRIALFVSVYKK